MADTLLLMIFSWASKRGNICCGRKMFLKEIRNIFGSRTQILCPQLMLPAGKQGNICVRHNVSANYDGNGNENITKQKA